MKSFFSLLMKKQIHVANVNNKKLFAFCRHKMKPHIFLHTSVKKLLISGRANIFFFCFANLPSNHLVNTVT